MMNKQTEALKMAIDDAITKFINEILDDNDSDSTWQSYAVQSAEMIRIRVKNACNEALEQPAQEPVAWYWDNNHRDKIPYAGVERGNPRMDAIYGTPIPLYTHPHQWQGLTDDVVASIWMHEAVPMNGQDFKKVYRAIEQALKEKNT
jgi:hypothetical protein